MGDIADMMINGEMCECCGEYLGGNGEGFARYCSKECAKNRGASSIENEDDEFSEDTFDEDHLSDYLISAISWMEMAMENAKALNLPKKEKSIQRLIKKIDILIIELGEK